MGSWLARIGAAALSRSWPFGKASQRRKAFTCQAGETIDRRDRSRHPIEASQ